MWICIEIMSPSIQERVEGDAETILAKVEKLQEAFDGLGIPDLTISILEAKAQSPD